MVINPKPGAMHYRNRIDLVSREGIYIDAFSLWQRKENLCILVDQDQHCTLPYSEDVFIEEIG